MMKHINADGEYEQVQAVVVLDKFDSNFHSIVPERPFALLPLAGAPIIDYTLSSLALAGVNETFLCSSKGSDLIKDHIEKSKKEGVLWSTVMSVHVIVSDSCTSFGDVLRDIDSRGLIRGFFILMGGDTISNVQLLPIFEAHKEASERDKSIAMTMVCKAAMPDDCIQYSSNKMLLGTDSYTKKVVFHKKVAKNSSKESFPLEIFLNSAELEIHNDLLDTHIAICSPTVLLLFTENFDFQTKDDFIKGIFMSEEILLGTIYWHKLEGDEYATRITDWKTYQSVSYDIMRRWAFPLTPDIGISKQENDCLVLRNHIYKSKDVTLDKTCTLDELVSVGPKSKIGKFTKITRSVIGNGCVIGENCNITDSFIMDGCVIGDNCKLIDSVVGPGSNLESTLILNNVIAACKLKMKRGELKNCIVDVDNVSKKNISNEETGYESDYDNTTDEESDDSECDIELEDTDYFLSEVKDSINRGYNENLKWDDLILEINSSRYAYNISLQEVNYNVIKAIFSLEQVDYAKKLNEMFTFFAPIIKNYIKGEEAMMNCLKAIEDQCEVSNSLFDCVHQVLFLLYNKDVVEEKEIMEWYKSLKPNNNLFNNARFTGFIKWLEEAEEDDDDDD